MKPVVHYVPNKYQSINVGYGACIIPIDHQSYLVSNTTWAMTSQVIRYNRKTGEFETLNSIYKKVK
jgi:hypothetical protein